MLKNEETKSYILTVYVLQDTVNLTASVYGAYGTF
jgi:hypothetical protein